MKVTIYELLGMVKDCKAPKKIRYIDKIFTYDELHADYVFMETYGESNTREYLTDWIGLSKDGLTDEVEILEEENKKCTVETCCIGMEGFCKALLKIKDDMKSIYENIDKVETLEEEKKIPEKLPIYDCIDAYSKFDITDNRKAINEIIDYLDYLKSKGDE